MAKFAVILRLVDGRAGTALLASSALVSLYFALYGGFVFYADSNVFFSYANELAHLRPGSYFHTLGYPLLIAITGFPWTGSVVPLLAVQAAFATLTPWLAFKTFAPFNRNAGIAAGIVCLASLTPFFFQNTFFHDGTSLFFGFLSITFASIFFAVRRPRFIYLSLVSAAFAYFVQQAEIGFVAGTTGAFALFALYDRPQRKHVAAALGIFLASVGGFSAFQKLSSQQDAFAGIIGRRLLFNEYLLGSLHEQFAGAAADQLRAELVRYYGRPWSGEFSAYIKSRLGHGEDEYQDLFGQYEGRPVELVHRIFAQPNRQYYEQLFVLPDMPDGIPDKVFLQASLAYLYQHPLVVAGYTWAKFVDFAIALPWQCRGDKTFPACQISSGGSFFPAASERVSVPPGSMPDKAARFLTSRHVSRGILMRAADGAWQWIYNFRLLLLASMLIGLVASFWRELELRWTLGAFVVAWVANMSVFSLFEGNEDRYQMVGIAMWAFAAGPGIYLLLSWLARAAVPAGSRSVHPV
jgi:hypothetical protein